MSQALEYLLKARPEAMGAYFKFLKEAGNHLDPKTRALISVITKVAVQTETGFKQYLTRALNIGVTPHEILDGLLMAFPVLGLAKIIWAVDILLEMEIPEFSLEGLDAEECWHELCPVDEVADGRILRISRDGRDLFVNGAGAEIVVFDSRCPHQVTNIPELAIAGRQLTCPKHGWVFCIDSGECIAKGDRSLKRFPCKVEADKLFAYW